MENVYSKFLYEDRMDEVAYKMDGDYDFGNLNYVGSGKIITKSDIITSVFNPKDEKYYHLTKLGRYFVLGRDEVEEIEVKRGIEQKTRLRIVAAMELRPTSEIDTLGYTYVFEINGVEVIDTERRSGIGLSLYQAVLTAGYTLLGDLYQYENARRIWSRLSKLPKFKVDIIDIERLKVIETDTEIDKDDPRVWAYQDATNKRDKKIGRTRRVVLHF